MKRQVNRRVWSSRERLELKIRSLDLMVLTLFTLRLEYRQRLRTGLLACSFISSNPFSSSPPEWLFLICKSDRVTLFEILQQLPISLRIKHNLFITDIKSFIGFLLTAPFSSRSELWPNWRKPWEIQSLIRYYLTSTRVVYFQEMWWKKIQENNIKLCNGEKCLVFGFFFTKVLKNCKME